MRYRLCWVMAPLVGIAFSLVASQESRKEFLTPLEIEKVQVAQEIDLRVKVYLEAAAARLKTTLDRLGGKESIPGEPLEFFSIDDMLDGYYRILHSVMLNVEDAAAKPSTEPAKLQSCLKSLKSGMEKNLLQLEALKRVVEQQHRKEADHEDHAHRRCRAGLLQHPPGESDPVQTVAEARDRLPGPQQSEGPVAQSV